MVRELDELTLDRERALVLDNGKHDRKGGFAKFGGSMEEQTGGEGKVRLLNGRVEPELIAAAGQIGRWRVLNAMSVALRTLSVVGRAPGSGCAQGSGSARSRRSPEVAVLMRVESLARRSTAMAAASVLLSGCAPADPVAEVFVTRDSVGIEIVENHAPVSSRVPTFVLSEHPLVVIGSDEDSPGHQLNEVVGAFRLDDGRVVVGDRGSREVRFFADDGRHLLSVGGEGGGPGEFRFLIAVDRLPGDTIVAGAWPPGLRVWWSSTGEFIRNTESGRWGSGLVGGRTLPDGTLLIDAYNAASYGNSVELWAVRGDDRTFRTEGVLVRVTHEGVPRDTIGPVIGEEWFKSGEPGRSDFANHTLPYTHRTHLAFNEDHVFLADSDRAEVRVYTYEGALVRMVRWEDEPTPITAGDRSRFRQEVLNGLINPARRPSFERWLTEVPYPESKPAFQGLTTDRLGRLWVESWTTDEGVDRWLIFERSGTLSGAVRAPSNTRLVDAGEDYVLVVATNELGVDTVQLFRLLED